MLRKANDNIRELVSKIIENDKDNNNIYCCNFASRDNNDYDCNEITCFDCKIMYYEELEKEMLDKYIVKLEIG